MQDTDYAKLGLKAGLEVHQQLDTKKLFIRTKSNLDDKINLNVQRKLRPVASELGEFDLTAIDAFKRDETFIYQGNYEEISLVEIDEEPPQPLDQNSLQTVLEVALLCNSKIIKEICVMRKTVIDGSNTSAFQRTMLVSIGGEFKIKNQNGEKSIGIETIALEEDAARPISKENNIINYNLDRLGIPLIELATAPDISTPQEAVETAKKIGEIMRLTCKTKRGKGTIRQDVNVSIREGERCEIKGCQELELIKTVVEKEVERQLDLIELKKELNQKFKKTNNLFDEVLEVTNAFENTKCKFIKGTVFGFKLNQMKGILGKKIGDRRFGSELSDYAKSVGVSGILHRDELPNYGIETSEVEKICKTLNCEINDNFIITVANKNNAQKAIETIKQRILSAFEGIVKETRATTENGASTYQRPLSSGTRMYPETDIINEIITKEKIEIIKKNLPKNVEEREKFYKKIGLNQNYISEMKLNNYARFFENLVKKGANPTIAATLLLQTVTELRREGINLDKISEKEIEEILLLEKKGKINKNNLKEIIKDLTFGKTLSEILQNKGESNLNEKEITEIISKIVKNNLELIKNKKLGSIGPLMGDLNKEEKLKNIDRKVLSELLRKEIQKNC